MWPHESNDWNELGEDRIYLINWNLKINTFTCFCTHSYIFQHLWNQGCIIYFENHAYIHTAAAYIENNLSAKLANDILSTDSWKHVLKAR